VHLINKGFSPEQETNAIVTSVKKWLGENEDKTCAILTPYNKGGAELADRLKKEEIEVVELLTSTQSTRQTAGALGNIIQYLSDPQSARKLATVYRVWRREWKEDEEYAELYKYVTALIRKTGKTEMLLAPSHADEWLSSLDTDESEEIIEEILLFRETVTRWLDAVTLPIDQLILTLAQDLFSEAADLALAHKLALVLKQAQNDHLDWRLPELTGELAVIAKNQRKFIGFSAEDSGFDPSNHKGKVVVATMHKAKGLEWDRVYLTSVNNYTFPSGAGNDSYISEKWFLRDNLNLEAEALAQLDAATQTGEYDWYSEGQTTLAARIDYVKERLRLLYVGITRAKEELVITWNTGRGEQTQALGVAALRCDE
jgi:DNA helicase-2/ATP-dependent DNA helicase PcrA